VSRWLNECRNDCPDTFIGDRAEEPVDQWSLCPHIRGT
jgi:hypothetical protein